MSGKHEDKTSPGGEAFFELPVLDSREDTVGTSDRLYWRSPADLARDPEYRRLAGQEFFPGADEAPSGPSRRQFIQIMGASMALAGLTACRRPVEKILPFDRKPEALLPGIPATYATGMPFRGTLRSVLVRSSDGRPTKVEGNPDHPEGTGATGVFEQATLLTLYDPDRSQVVLRNGSPAAWSDFVAFVTGLPAGTRLAVIATPSSSSARVGLQARLRERFESLYWAEYAATGDDASIAASRRLFGRALRPDYQLENARTILSLDADFLGTVDRNMIGNTRGFTAGRRAAEDGQMNRLYMVESSYTITGAAADNRLTLRPSLIPGFAAAVARKFGHAVSGGEELDDHPFLEAVAADLSDAGASGVVIAGDGQGEDVHALAAAVNERLGAVGTTVTYLETSEDGAATRIEDLRRIADAASRGEIDLLVMLGCSPLHDAPADLQLSAALAAVPDTVHLGLHVDETAGACSWHLPETHFLEAWGDGRSVRGTRSVVQPLIAPLYEPAHSDIELLALLAGGAERSGYDVVRETWRSFVTGSFEQAWRRALHDGFLAGSAYAALAPTVDASALPTGVSGPGADALELVIRLDPSVLDGSYANNAWVQELPDPITKVTWDNVALMSPATAAASGLEMNLRKGRYFVDRARITVEDRSIEIPVWVLPGVADDTIVLSLGYGRSIASNRPERRTIFFDLDDYTDIYGHGAVGNGVGVNVAPVRSTRAMRLVTGASISKAASGYLVASTQDHGALPVEGFEVERRGLYRSATLEEFREDPEFVMEMQPQAIREEWAQYPTLWEENHPQSTEEFQDNDYFQHQWAMTIDLNTCTGCNACVVACQAENNIQVVGKQEVSRGRELHWIRVDRYFVSGAGGSYDHPRMVVQPVPCMHCENAPCEQVCPVAATVHSPDGTNQMVYNRCIGTRYCANNCPYKVRRFNYYNWTKTLPQSVHMAQNPYVTVRSRGVMEKCSFCIQRIRDMNRRTSVEGREMRLDEVQTACQQACPARAITFGDLTQGESRVNATRRSPRRYEMLAELLVKPRTSYLARITNPNPLIENEAEAG